MVCYCNTPVLLAYTSPAQTVGAAGLVVYNINRVQTCTGIQHTAGTPTVTMSNAGVYNITVNMDIEPATAGTLTVQVNNNGVAIPDATTAFTAVADNVTHITLDTVVKVLPSCCAVNNTANITVTLSAESTVTNASIIVEKM